MEPEKPQERSTVRIGISGGDIVYLPDRETGEPSRPYASQRLGFYRYRTMTGGMSIEELERRKVEEDTTPDYNPERV
tara:strand:- start:256 stop:486 length:231 start_codon:yes stop_codon:yes gene_type:complete